MHGTFYSGTCFDAGYDMGGDRWGKRGGGSGWSFYREGSLNVTLPVLERMVQLNSSSSDGNDFLPGQLGFSMRTYFQRVLIHFFNERSLFSFRFSFAWL